MIEISNNAGTSRTMGLIHAVIKRQFFAFIKNTCVKKNAAIKKVIVNERAGSR